MRCGRCGNENNEANRFCGMCGAPLVAKTADAGPSQGPVAERRPAASPDDTAARTEPVITGPSFLGLNTPPAGQRGGRHADTGHDPLKPSSNLDYLLDEEAPKDGPGKLILVVVALLLAVGFGYLHWKQGGFDWLNTGEKKPAAATPAPEAAQNSPDSGGTAATPAGGANGSGTTATGGAAPVPTDSAAPQATPTQTGSQAAPAQSTPPQSAAAPSAVPPSKTGDSSAAADSASPPASSDAEGKSPATEPPAGAKAEARKPAAKPAAAKPADPVTLAENYIYGRGVPQDCDHGLRSLKRAADQSNVKAMISFGVVYSTGTCTPRDLPTAYRWFAQALHKEPDNQALQDDLQKLWSQMTPPERQLAIKLSQ